MLRFCGEIRLNHCNRCAAEWHTEPVIQAIYETLARDEARHGGALPAPMKRALQEFGDEAARRRQVGVLMASAPHRAGATSDQPARQPGAVPARHRAEPPARPHWLERWLDQQIRLTAPGKVVERIPQHEPADGAQLRERAGTQPLPQGSHEGPSPRPRSSPGLRAREDESRQGHQAPLRAACCAAATCAAPNRRWHAMRRRASPMSSRPCIARSRPLSRPAGDERPAHRRRGGPRYHGVRGVTRLVGASIDTLLAATSACCPARRRNPPEREALVAALNGVWATGWLHRQSAGHRDVAAQPRARAASRNRLACRRAARHGPEAARARPWSVHERPDLQRGSRPRRRPGARDLGMTPVYLHYNSGLPIAANGRLLAALLRAARRPMARRAAREVRC